jgi:modification methylase
LVNRHTLIVGDSRSMPEIESGSIQFIVTSPPYWNLKNYGRDPRFTIRHQDEEYSTYLRSIYDVLKEIKRVIEPGRFVAINVGTAVSRQGMKPLHADIIKEMENLHLTFKKEIIWAKPKGTQGLWQRGVTKFLKKEPFPCYFNLNIMHEYILIFQNEGRLKVNLNADSKLSEEFIKQVSWSIWEMPVSTSKGHPAPFPDSLPERLIRLYSFENETVLDPFGGSGTTMKAANMLNRNSIIYEINPEYVELIKNKVNWENPNLDSQALYDIKVRMEESYNNS